MFIAFGSELNAIGWLVIFWIKRNVQNVPVLKLKNIVIFKKKITGFVNELLNGRIFPKWFPVKNKEKENGRAPFSSPKRERVKINIS